MYRLDKIIELDQPLSLNSLEYSEQKTAPIPQQILAIIPINILDEFET